MINREQAASSWQGPELMDTATERARALPASSERHRVSADVFSTMGTFAPAMGMIGTLIGLVKMLHALDNPANIGPAMAVALLSTLYGALLANLVFFPLSGKLRYRSWRESIMRELTLEGVVGVASGDHPAVLEQKLVSFITPTLEQEVPATGTKGKAAFALKSKKKAPAKKPRLRM